MAKRARSETATKGKVQSLFGDPAQGWDPIEHERRDQSYVRKIRPLGPNQRVLMEAIDTHSLTVALGPAGTGKTYIAVAAAVEALEDGAVNRIVLSRPAVEAGETLGYLPGDLHEKLAPYLRPLYDALNDRLGGKRVRQLIADGTIEVAPIAYMRGRTLNNAFVVIDEAQNCTYGQLKMLLTRLGWHATMVLTGDPDQSDLLDGLSGLSDIARRLEAVASIAVVRLDERDIVRHPLVGEMLTVQRTRNGPPPRGGGPSRSCRFGSERLENGFRARHVELARLLHRERLDHAVVHDHGVALRAHAHAVRGQVELEAEGLGQVAAAVGDHQHLVADVLVLAPGAHDEGVVDRQADDRVDALGPDRVGLLDEARQVARRAGRREGAG